MPYRQKGRRAYQTDVSDYQGRVRPGCSCGTDDYDTAVKVEERRDEWRKSRDVGRPVLAAIVDGELALADAYDADLESKLESKLREVEAARAARAAVAAMVDLDPLVGEWTAAGATTRYVDQVRRLIPAGVPFPVAQFRRGTIKQFLDTLTFDKGGAATKGSRLVSPSTRNRYRSALSVFAQWLVEREVLDQNPLRDVASYTVRKVLPVQLSRVQLVKVLAKLPDDAARAAVALMAHGVEWGAVEKARRSHFDLTHTPPLFDAHPGGTGIGKTEYRSRAVTLGERWLVPHVAGHVATLADDAAPFSARTHDQVADVLEAALAAAGAPRITMHELRDTYAITALKRGDDHQDIKRNLGHSPRSTLLYTTYGTYINDPRAKREDGDDA